MVQATIGRVEGLPFTAQARFRVRTREMDAGAAARIANSCACAVDPPAIELLMGEATREESAARCRRSDIRSRQHVAETY